MKTKHLFLATALVASFASCTNDDIVEVQQGVANADRPTVDNVQLNFVGEGVDSRLAFGSKGYTWEADDVIGALLMDQPTGNTDKDAEWAKKYNLSNYVNTSYPFTYNADTKVWSNDAKMLEGNYFFAFPFSSYDGGRYVIHSLKGQTQTGVASSVVAKSYADNQFFVGYSQIFGGTEAKDALNDVEMASILGGIQFRIINNGSKTYHINKIVVRGTDVATELQLIPQGAWDDTKEEYVGGFNYANYVGDEEATGYEADVVEAEDFNRADLLRALVVDTDPEAGMAQLKINGTDAERAVAKGGTAYAVVMLNPFKVESGDELMADIYTDQGVIANINLLVPIKDNKASNYEGVLVDKSIEKVGYDVANTVIIKFTDDAIGSIQESKVADEADLLQLIEWNATSDIKVTATATLENDVELTKEMFDLLKGNKNVTLAITGAYELTLAEDLPADVLDYKGLDIDAEGDDAVTVVVANEINLTEDTPAIKAMVVAKGGVVNVNDAKAVLPTEISNEGTVNFGEKAIASVTLTNEEKGIINVAKGADVKGADNTKFVNNGKVNNNGYVEHISNEADATIVLGENATLKDLVNKTDATVNTANGAQVAGANKGLINFVTGATINVSGTGMVSAEAPASVGEDEYEDTSINTLTLKENTVTTIAAEEIGGITTIIAAKGATLKIANGVDFVLGSLIVDENITIITNTTEGDNASSLTIGSVTLAEDVELTNNGALNITTSWKNEGIVYNNGSTNLYASAEGKTGVFKYAEPTFGAPSQTADEKLKAAVKAAMKPLVEAYLNNSGAIADGNIDSWNEITAEKVMYSYRDNYGKTYAPWVTNAANAFIEVYNEIEGIEVVEELSGTVLAEILGETYKEQLTGAVAAVKSDVSLTTAIQAIGNEWIGNNVWTKTKSDQLYKNIANGEMDSAWRTKVGQLTKQNIGGAAWLSLKDKLTELASKTDADKIAFYSSVLPAKSFIPVYEASDEYKVLKVYADMLENEYVQANKECEATAVAENFAEVAAYLSKLYAEAAKDGAEYYFDKAVTAAVTTAVLDNAEAFKAYTNGQFAALVSNMENITGVELGANIGK